MGTRVTAVYLGDFKSLSRRCQELSSVGATVFLGRRPLHCPRLPEDVVEQWWRSFAGRGAFQADYGRLDLISITRHDESIA